MVFSNKALKYGNFCAYLTASTNHSLSYFQLIYHYFGYQVDTLFFMGKVDSCMLCIQSFDSFWITPQYFWFWTCETDFMTPDFWFHIWQLLFSSQFEARKSLKIAIFVNVFSYCADYCHYVIKPRRILFKVSLIKYMTIT